MSSSQDREPAACSSSRAELRALRWRRVFPGEACELAAMRRFLAALLPDCSARDDVMCVATELGSNALRHTASGRGGLFAVEIAWDATLVRIAVRDGGAPSGPRITADLMKEDGRGLVVVRGLSQCCGFSGDERGRLVWADVPWTAAPAPPVDPWAAAVHDSGGGLTEPVADERSAPVLQAGLA
jgi:serine/threonine-protein kinase RsbW